ncbi:hypothetical protein CLCR_08635 [Cladophialophora carrionii]|uniref:Large ribosomal subunit protein mL50 n=1 Tax=Cladophialophora carrionii TaxID=86049 RepID=A0A1C1CQW6_9EURO|nr:hypothetical protein CLCR_08635 [Cladophialophora carrionii]
MSVERVDMHSSENASKFGTGRLYPLDQIYGKLQVIHQMEEPAPAEEGVSMEPYVEATTWDGLEHVGHQGHWKDLPPDAKDEYEPWLDPTQATPPQRDQFLSLLWISIVECLALKQLNSDPNTIHTDGPPNFAGGMASLKIQLSGTGTISHLDDPHGTLKQAKAGSEAVGAQGSEMEFSVSEIEEQLQDARFDFHDPTTFAILKRFSELTGHRVPDPVLNTVLRGNKPLVAFIDLLTQSAKPKPKKFAEVLLAKQKKAVDFAAREKLLAEQGLQAHTGTAVPTADATEAQAGKQKPKFKPLGPNVMIFTRRETQVDREMEIGRWKVIKRELENRGLPVYPIPKLVPAGETWRKEEGGVV